MYNYSRGVPSGKKTNKQTKKPRLLIQGTQETWVHYMDWEHPLEEKMATYSSIIAWRIP